jgi:Fic family protein
MASKGTNYIHQRSDWPQFTWALDRFASLLSDVRLQQGRLLGKMQAYGFGTRQEVMLAALTEETVKSSAIEGVVLDANSVRSSIARRLRLKVAGTSTKEHHNVEGVVKMMLDATQKFGKPLTDVRLFDWHSDVFSEIRSSTDKFLVGAWRDDHDGPMQVVCGQIGKWKVHFEAPPAKQVKHEMTQFLAWFNSEAQLDPLLKAAIAHLWFVTIHPFEDGNGRITRAIAEMALARSDKTAQRFYSMSAQILEEKSEYYRVVEESQKGNLDITEWLIWFLSCLGRALDKAGKLTASAIGKEAFWRLHRELLVNERQKKMLNILLTGLDGVLTRKKWQRITRCQRTAAASDIQFLIDAGILKQNSGGGRSTSYSLVRAADSIRKTVIHSAPGRNS